MSESLPLNSSSGFQTGYFRRLPQRAGTAFGASSARATTTGSARMRYCHSVAVIEARTEAEARAGRGGLQRPNALRTELLSAHFPGKEAAVQRAFSMVGRYP